MIDGISMMLAVAGTAFFNPCGIGIRACIRQEKLDLSEIANAISAAVCIVKCSGRTIGTTRKSRLCPSQGPAVPEQLALQETPIPPILRRVSPSSFTPISRLHGLRLIGRAERLHVCVRLKVGPCSG